MSEFKQIFPLGEKNDAYAQYFIGQSYNASLATGSVPINNISLEPGSVIRVPAGSKHWHGAKADSWFSHVAFITPGEGVSNEWLEPVTDEVYSQLPHSSD